MKHPERVGDYLEHIAEAIEHAIVFIESVDGVASLERDYKTQAPVIRCIEIIGEAREQDSAAIARICQSSSRNTVATDAGHA